MRNILKNAVIRIIALEARLALFLHRPKVIAVTGNVGKTSTKDAIFAVVSRAYKTRRSDKSYNSEIGLPLAILGLESAWSSPSGWFRNIISGFFAATWDRSFPEWLILEVGADHPGDIEKISAWLHPDIVVLTRMSDVPVHVEYFDGPDHMLQEKMFLAKALKPGGTLIVNGDDEHFQRAVKEIDAKKLFYGSTPGSSVEILETGITYTNNPLPMPVGQYADMRIGDASERIEIRGVLGRHVMYPIAAACAVAIALGIEPSIQIAFLNFKSPKGRMKILKGINSTSIIDDTYNSSPIACVEALRSVSVLSIRGRKIGVLADMKELGESAMKAHKDMGRVAFETLHTLVTVGDMAKLIADGARYAGMAHDRIYSFADSDEAAKAMADMVRAGDVVLVKGSQSMRMEKVSKALLEDKMRSEEFLVRQEREWLER